MIDLTYAAIDVMLWCMAIIFCAFVLMCLVAAGLLVWAIWEWHRAA